ncbi:quinon protein alcohol dehydrogenase-like superfamily [Bipolaris maydis]|uniref:quinon protein alcohol dehydrogenase-like superfamily n=1 Tax=Cochliobolus heterostrophus TaxID=5016 RepID=UPI0024DB0495|nr:quinon protein alcohol dehydrogenase-like superfamily [Bipolaris maydis]KAJ5058619.1 elongator protein 2 [Bipolaris maydis]KAJ6269345.1 quinon protein alcohol dehydrogenase-like superfamily [Bipolaris maydis]
MHVSPEFIATGGNRNPAAADWDDAGLQFLAFGADNNIALWDPQFFPTQSPDVSVLLSGSADNTIRIWRGRRDERFECLKTISEHQQPVTRIATVTGSDTFATGSSDGTVKIWRLTHSLDFASIAVDIVQTITLSPKYFPLNLALAKLDESSTVLAVAGTRTTIQIFVSQDSQFQLSATLTGHEGWIRALAFTKETADPNSDLLLASASQDKYIRLWRLHRGDELPAASTALNDPALGGMGKSLSNKAHWISSPTSKHSITFEALLLGHEDWIYQASWRHRDGKLQLLSASEDNSLSIWESDPTSGVWVCITRLGEISAQKGSTSATGSAGGFWIGLWSPDGNTVVSLGRTGSWRKWSFSATEDMWTQQVAVTGHVREVKGVSWSRDGSYLLTTGTDQTTRLYSQWKRDGMSPSWHEFSRPQIHGYDLNCIDTVSDTQFISGADEKLLRVFDEPKGVADMLHKLCDTRPSDSAALPDAANIPVLGLSNKAIQAVGDEDPIENGNDDDREAIDPASVIRKSTLDFKHPPFEDHLARHLLWPETEKLYGHGYEISALAISHNASLVATACRASSIDHAVIRLYDTKEWLEVKPPLKAHSLTVTSLAFSQDDKYLLSVGRDRQWVIWERSPDAPSLFALKHANPKGHSRMILDAAWTAIAHHPTFMTAGRDKSVKIWQMSDVQVTLKATVAANAPVTAVACNTTRNDAGSKVVFAFGTENGDLGIGSVGVEALDQVAVAMVEKEVLPAKTINQIVWRPGTRGEGQEQIAVASDDTSVRIFSVKDETS